MILILCHLQDAEAAWLSQRLQHLAPEVPVRLVSAEELLYARRVQHTLGHAPAGFALTLQNGQRIEAAEVAVLVNRLCFLDPVVWQRAGSMQYLYVLQEINALYLSMLHALPAERLYNPPSAAALGGRYLTPAEWQLLGARVGLPIAVGWSPEGPVAAAWPHRRLLMLNDEVLGSPPPDIAPALCRELARQAGLPLLELHFDAQGAGHVFVGATVFAALHQYGDALVHHFLQLATDGFDMGNSQRVARAALAG